MRVKILKDGKYANTAMRNQNLDAGDVLDTAEWYAEGLVGKGLAAYDLSAPIPDSEDELVDGQETISVSVDEIANLDDLKNLPKAGTPKASIDEEGKVVDFTEIVPGLSQSMSQVLIDSGFYNIPLLSEAKEKQILSLPGVGKGTWNKIKAWQKSLE